MQIAKSAEFIVEMLLREPNIKFRLRSRRVSRVTERSGGTRIAALGKDTLGSKKDATSSQLPSSCRNAVDAFKLVNHKQSTAQHCAMRPAR